MAKILRFFWNPYKVNIPSGFCPCQCEGFLRTGEWYYFRSRWDTWSLYIAKSEKDWADDNCLFQYSETFDNDLIGGWIGPLKGYLLLNKAMRIYHKDTRNASQKR